MTCFEHYLRCALNQAHCAYNPVRYSEMTTFLCSTACLNDTIARSAFDASLFVHRMDLSKVLIHFMHNLDKK